MKKLLTLILIVGFAVGCSEQQAPIQKQTLNGSELRNIVSTNADYLAVVLGLKILQQNLTSSRSTLSASNQTQLHGIFQKFSSFSDFQQNSTSAEAALISNLPKFESSQNFINLVNDLNKHYNFKIEDLIGIIHSQTDLVVTNPTAKANPDCYSQCDYAGISVLFSQYLSYRKQGFSESTSANYAAQDQSWFVAGCYNGCNFANN